MFNYKFTLATVMILFLLNSLILAAGREATKLLDKVQKVYAALDNVCTEFEQTFYWKLTDERQTINGSLCAKGGDKFRIETPEQFIVTDGDVLWTMNKMNNQVIIDYAENATNDNPFIKNFMNKYLTEYDAAIDPTRSDDARTCVALNSKTGEHFVPMLWLWIHKKTDLIEKIEQLDLNENTTTFVMSNLDTKATLSNGDFKFKAPDGADIIDMR